MNGTGEGSGAAADASEVRDFVAALVRAGAPDAAGPAGPAVPEGTAEEVIAVARRLALRAAPERRWRPRPAPVLLRVARALVVDEHPSAAEWPVAERQRLALWVAVLIEHRGEDGVQELLRELDEG
ncbi:hypothetical protein ACFRMQ_31300 [Kitasatospora sp. NPDC056783]|uniref:hypothetical protein n=1 Tax=Kitasatospora sp. NPDC056783 TaxID=3345943 RepID=UPI00369832A3